MNPCDFCTKCYPGSKLLHQHVKSVHRDVLPICDLCCKSFPDLKSLDKHKETHYARLHAPCPVCGFVVPAYTLNRHVNEYHPLVTNWVCDACGDAFPEVEDFRNHIKGCSAEGGPGSRRHVACYLCNRPFFTDRDFLEHMDGMHCEDREEVGKCEVCAETFYTHQDMLKHEGNCRMPILERIIKTRKECRKCPNTRTETYRTFRNEKYLKKHQENMHAEEPEIPCFESECDQKFTSYSKLLVHVEDCHTYRHSEANLEQVSSS